MGPRRSRHCLSLLLLALGACANAFREPHKGDGLANLRSRASARRLGQRVGAASLEALYRPEAVRGAEAGTRPVSRSVLNSGGSVLSDPVEVVLIFYGTSDDAWPESRKAVVKQLLAALPSQSQGDEPATVHNWWNVARLYKGADGKHVSSQVALKDEIGVTASPNNLTEKLVYAIVGDLFDLKRISKTPNTVYAFLTSPEVSVTGPSPCGWHSAVDIHLFWVGLGQESTTCGPALPPGYTYPQGSKAATALVAEFARQLVHVATDPNGVAPKTATADCSARPYGNVFEAPGGVAYNKVGPFGVRYLLPVIQNPVSGACVGELDVLPGECGDSAYGLPCDVEGQSEAAAGAVEIPLHRSAAAAVELTPGREVTPMLEQQLEGISLPGGSYLASAVGKPLAVEGGHASAVGKPLAVEDSAAKDAVTAVALSSMGQPLGGSSVVSAVGNPLQVPQPGAAASAQAVIDFARTAVGHPLEAAPAEGQDAASAKAAVVSFAVSAVGHALDPLEPTCSGGSASAVGKPLTVEEPTRVFAVGKPLKVGEQGAVVAVGKPLQVEPQPQAASAVGTPLKVEDLAVPAVKAGAAQTAVGNPLQVQPSGGAASAVGEPLKAQSSGGGGGLISAEAGSYNMPGYGAESAGAYGGSVANLKWAQEHAGR